MAALVGKPTPLVFLASLVVAIPTAISYALMSREIPSSGSAATWTRRTTGRPMGTWLGLMMVIYYVIAAIIQPIFFGMFFNDFLGLLGVRDTGIGTLMIGLILLLCFGAFLTYRGIQESTKVVVVAVAIEVATVLALSITILVVVGSKGGLNAEPFDPAQIQGGLNSFLLAMILGVFSFTGFDVVSTVAEEAKAPRKLLPKATLLAVGLVGVFWALNSYAFSVAIPVSEVKELAASGLTAATPIARQYWGMGSILVIITALTAVSGVFVACVTGASRAIWALGREGMLPSSVSKVSPRRSTPTNALHITFAGCAVGGIGMTLVMGNGIDAFVWWANSLSFFALITYVFVNLSALIYFRRNPGRGNTFATLVAPILGIAVDVYLLYAAFFQTLLAAGWRMGTSIVVFGLAAAVLCAAFMLVRRRHQSVDLDAEDEFVSVEL